MAETETIPHHLDNVLHESASPLVMMQEPGTVTPASVSETDTFEDAVDASPVRSLTRRKNAGMRSPSPEPESDSEDGKHHPLEVSVDELPTHETSPESFDVQSRKAAHLSAVSARDSLDNVALNDDDANTIARDSSQIITSDSVSRHAEKSKNTSIGTALVQNSSDSTGSVRTSRPTRAATNAAATAPLGKPSKPLSLSNIKLPHMPPMPWSPPTEKPDPVQQIMHPPIPEKPTPPPPQTQGLGTRKLTSPFSWLSRTGTKELPQSHHSNRVTSSSNVGLMGSPELMLGRLETERQARLDEAGDSLKDRFKFVRMREEAALTASPIEDKDRPGEDAVNTAGKTAVDAQSAGIATPSSPALLSPDRSMAPGTASGVSAGPSEENATVDWDLWQSVVYEGPAAVARTSAEELNKAIATGIPNAIRGVIWQVLAQSKNEGLETVYHELVARGSDKEKSKEKEHRNRDSGGSSGRRVPSSSASSVHSGNGASPTASEKDADVVRNHPITSAPDLKVKEKEQAVMLQKLERAIRRDLGARTSYSKFAAAAGLQDGLFGVCKAYALFDEPVGYAQGMNFIVMPLLFNMREEEAFSLLVRMMNHYGLRDMFIEDMPGLHKALYQFERLLEDFEPALYCHLHRRGISPHLYATQWFLTLFAYRFPLQLVLRIYDLVLSEGLSAVLRFGIVLMQKNAKTLLAMHDMTALTTQLKDKLFDVYIDANPTTGSLLESGFFGSSSSAVDKEVYRADQLVRDACDVHITPEMLKVYADEWEDKTRVEKEREVELLELRASNASLAHRVRALETQIETCDREQTSLATELVHTKVRNEELCDENESLSGQVRELRIVIEKQPEEIESVWQAEREDLMKRNAKVHEENQRLEKELAELEEELVQTKMRYAEINAQHETLSRKWADLRKQLG